MFLWKPSHFILKSRYEEVLASMKSSQDTLGIDLGAETF